ncbi:FAD-dependent oxidoreductase [Sediminispirochaeta smaragdinae]|uniref:FAD dependent oxidoreductase n=1 Tax=Sediminispirochaeta smaragdinae (strain DSM 11293 / JCM 15392 / SEBR 4228) TaxID=573413 RepID=E1R3W0_SEDSS|nr:FAD-dependent oxidoreductase [Sediminispirochaeta smaragdinae]ADK82081.1 FAD dependent oxidoreductase [Sediminispirochaeta smaragdinae DSM 11293]
MMNKGLDTIICRCEEITLTEVLEAIDAGCSTISAVKRYTRAGMGPCQGRGCARAIAQLIAQRTGNNRAELRPDRARFPIVPTEISAFSSIREEPLEKAETMVFPQRKTCTSSLPIDTKESYDVIVIGGGYHGLSIARQLAEAGVKTILLERREIGSGSSGANFGFVQLQDSNTGISFELNRRGFERMGQMENELSADLEYRKVGSLIFAQTDEQMAALEALYREKHALGLDVRCISPRDITSLEPYMNVKSIKGASWHLQAQINPFRYLFAMVKKGKEAGLTIRENTIVREILVSDASCKGIVLANGECIRSNVVVVAAGAHTGTLCSTCGLEVPIEYVIGEAFVSEPVQPHIMNFISSASFFATAHDSTGAAASFTAGQTASGNVLIGETSEPGPSNPEDALLLTSAAHCVRIPRMLEELYPALKRLTVLRSWATCSPSAPGFEPFLGATEIEGLFLAAGFKSSVVISSAVGQILTDLIVRGRTWCDISCFNRGRVKWSGASKDRFDRDENRSY